MKMKDHILIVEDEVKISDLIGKYLVLEGFEYSQAYNGLQAIQLVDERKPDIIILDIMLPDMDGLAVCEKIRQTSSVPILMLTARGEDVDRLIGFAKGADDYVCKPFNPQELVARVKAILRRSQSRAQQNIINNGPVSLSINEFSAKVEGVELQLTQLEFSLLHTLMSNPTQVYSREELLTAIHGKYAESYERTIDFHIKNLRKKMNLNNKHNYIKTVYGVGYKFH